MADTRKCCFEVKQSDGTTMVLQSRALRAIAPRGRYNRALEPNAVARNPVRALRSLLRAAPGIAQTNKERATKGNEILPARRQPCGNSAPPPDPLGRRSHHAGGSLVFGRGGGHLARKANEVGFRASETSGEDGAGVVDKDRTSRTATLPAKDAVVGCIRERLATIAGMPEMNLEPLQVTEYAHQDCYKPHYDALGFKNAPDRRKTMFAYLKDDGLLDGKCGGATAFCSLRGKDGRPLRVYPRKGRALVWENFTPKGLSQYPYVARRGARDMRRKPKNGNERMVHGFTSETPEKKIRTPSGPSKKRAKSGAK